MLCQYADSQNTIVHLVDQYGNDRNVAPDYEGDFRLSNGVADVLALLNKTQPDPYVAPPAPDLTAQDLATIEAQLAALGTFDRALFILVLQQLNVCRAAITALNTKTGLTGNSVPQIPLATAKTALQNAMRGNLPS